MPNIGKIPVYCHMSNSGLGECGGGGWTLVMKIDGTEVTNELREGPLFLVLRFRLMVSFPWLFSYLS